MTQELLGAKTGEGVAVFNNGPTLNVPFMSLPEINCAATRVLSTTEVSGTILHNAAQPDSTNVTITLPIASKGLMFNAIISNALADSNYWELKANAADIIYFYNINGILTMGTSGQTVRATAQPISTNLLGWTFRVAGKASGYNWIFNVITGIWTIQ